MNAIKLITIVTLFLFASSTQDPEGINITIRKGHKKITYVAENVTDLDIDLFFRVESSGFRRSADRPLITTIPAKSKKDLITLIPLKGKDTTHTYMAIATKKQDHIEVRKTDTLAKDIIRIDPNKK